MLQTQHGVPKDRKRGKIKVPEKKVASIDRKNSVRGSIGRAVASDTRGPGFESSHWQYFQNEHIITVEKKENVLSWFMPIETKRKERERENTNERLL